MIINKINFPIYGIMILVALIIGMCFNIIFLKKQNIKNQHIALFVFMASVYSMFGGVILNSITTGSFDFTKFGLSSYGGAFGILVSAIMFEKMTNSNKEFIKSAVLSLPLIYSISKLACFFAGCCYGIPYSGIFSVIYPYKLNFSVFPIQLAETISFFIVFVVCLLFRKNKYNVGITIVLSAFTKFLLDFLRYDHLSKFITINQIISIGFIAVTIILYTVKNNINKSNKYCKK